MNHLYRICFLVLVAMFGTSISVKGDVLRPTFVDKLVSPYLEIQQALAGDDLKSAQAGAKACLGVLASGPQKVDSQTTLGKITVSTKSIENAADIAAARRAFLELSNAMISVIKDIGCTVKESLYVANCPMAFGNKGGDWIQVGKEINNPYHGAKMEKCGSIKEQIAGEGSEVL